MFYFIAEQLSSQDVTFVSELEELLAKECQ